MTTEGTEEDEEVGTLFVEAGVLLSVGDGDDLGLMLCVYKCFFLRFLRREDDGDVPLAVTPVLLWLPCVEVVAAWTIGSRERVSRSFICEDEGTAATATTDSDGELVCKKEEAMASTLASTAAEEHDSSKSKGSFVRERCTSAAAVEVVEVDVDVDADVCVVG